MHSLVILRQKKHGIEQSAVVVKFLDFPECLNWIQVLNCRCEVLCNLSSACNGRVEAFREKRIMGNVIDKTDCYEDGTQLSRTLWTINL